MVLSPWVTVGAGRVSVSHRPKCIEVPQLAKAGCQCVVTLLSEREGAARIGHQVENAKMAWVWLPVPNGRYPEDETHAILLAGVKQVWERLDRGEAAHIHCSAGIHRTGMFTFGLLRWRGYSQEEALELIARMRIHTREGILERHIRWGNTLAAQLLDADPNS